MPKEKSKKKKTNPRRSVFGIENDRPAQLSREGRNLHDPDEERVTNEAPLSNEGRSDIV